MQIAGASNKRESSRVRAVLGVVAIFSVAIIVRLANLNHDPLTDELYHVLAAISWNESGTLQVAEGEYRRAALFTLILSSVAKVFGDDLSVMRVVCAVIGALFVAAYFLGIRCIVGRNEAWIAGLMLAFMPGAIFLSQYIRFYSLHALTFWLAALALYVMLHPETSRERKIPLLAISAALLAVSLHLQITTAIGMVGLFFWMLLENSGRIGNVFASWSKTKQMIGIAAITSIVLASTLLLLGPLKSIVDLYRWSPAWSANNSPLYYYFLYRAQFGWLFTLWPMAFVIALITNRRPALFLGVIFVVCTVVQSFGGIQAERFNFYTMPFFVGVLAIAGMRLIISIDALVTESLHGYSCPLIKSNNIRTLSRTMLITGFGFAVLSMPATELTAKMLLDREVSLRGTKKDLYWSKYTTSWTEAKEDLAELSRRHDLLVTSQGLHALYFLDRLDLEINKTRLSDLGSTDLFQRDPRTGRMVTSTAAGLEKAVSCFQSGIVIIHQLGWRANSIVDDETADYIDSTMDKISVSHDWGLIVYTWRHERLRDDSICGGIWSNHP